MIVYEVYRGATKLCGINAKDVRVVDGHLEFTNTDDGDFGTEYEVAIVAPGEWTRVHKLLGDNASALVIELPWAEELGA